MDDDRAIRVEARPPRARAPSAAGRADAAHRAALGWQVTLWSGEVTPEEQAAFVRWRAADPAHEQAWARVAQVGRQLHAVPGAVAGPVLRDAAARPARGRRGVLRGLAWLAGAGLGAQAVRQAPAWQAAVADLRTARGERRDVRLPDGSRLTLNTASAVDLQFDDRERRLRLHAGEILVETAAASATAIGRPDRPFVVDTRAGRLRALGTRFVVRQPDDAATGSEMLVQVFDGAVEIAPVQGAAPSIVRAGQQARFTRDLARPSTAVDPTAAAWTRGLLVAERWRLADLLAELGRYRAGIVRCDPAVAELAVSGVFSLQDTDAALAALGRTLPVRVQRATRYWVQVAAR